jgi:hypothetical protein
MVSVLAQKGQKETYTEKQFQRHCHHLKLLPCEITYSWFCGSLSPQALISHMEISVTRIEDIRITIFQETKIISIQEIRVIKIIQKIKVTK